MSKAFNGHKNWNHWNVSLWINNDESLYRLALSKIRTARNTGGTRDDAAEMMRVTLLDIGQSQTPDGAPYTASSIRAAMVGM